MKICEEDVVLIRESCRQAVVNVNPGDIYRVTVSGDINIKAEEVEVSAVVTDIGFSAHEPSAFFRHEDFIKVDDDDDD
ncbi:hypothetical protein SAMN05877753_1181 [Bacillus oleivorans]|uniref:Uncharacterized protein n=1 Tax=Bacillus oleivorans TaxID=1448271 RepID=A0A285D7I8_9BACI|nr:hypothetical protein [Bacillus oleivorans]SNX75770.1 hypothetical protein SAMN05877753_1181 [Bacillus oleivorans]